MRTTNTLSYAAGCRHALARVKIAGMMQGMVAPTLAGAAIGGVGGAAMAPEGQGLQGALLGGSIGAAGGAGGAALGHMAGQGAASRAAMHNTQAPAEAQALIAAGQKTLQSPGSMQLLGGAAGAGAGGVLGARAAGNLSEGGVEPMPYEDDPYYMAEMQRMQQMQSSR